MIRLWAEFETALRSYYNGLKNDPDSRIGARDLIDTLAASRRGRALADSARLEVHEVREYRDSLVHDRDEGRLKRCKVVRDRLRLRDGGGSATSDRRGQAGVEQAGHRPESPRRVRTRVAEAIRAGLQGTTRSYRP